MIRSLIGVTGQEPLLEHGPELRKRGRYPASRTAVTVTAGEHDALSGEPEDLLAYFTEAADLVRDHIKARPAPPVRTEVYPGSGLRPESGFDLSVIQAGSSWDTATFEAVQAVLRSIIGYGEAQGDGPWTCVVYTAGAHGTDRPYRYEGPLVAVTDTHIVFGGGVAVDLEAVYAVNI